MSNNHLHLAGSGETIHFYHANGFPAGVYQPFLQTLNQDFDVYALQSRATWPDMPAPQHTNWHIYADDLIEFIEKLGKPIIAIGHSMGASATVLAAGKRPDLFKALILIEPAMVSLPMSLLLQTMPKKIINDLRLIKGTANKPDTWSSKEEYLTYIKKFKGYRQFSDESFHYFSDNAIKQKNGKFKLLFPKQWEAYNYTNPPYLMRDLTKLDKLNIPTIAIRGKPNMFFSHKLWDRWTKVQKKAIFLENENFSHLFPLEGPEECMTLIKQGLKQLNIT